MKIETKKDGTVEITLDKGTKAVVNGDDVDCINGTRRSVEQKIAWEKRALDALYGGNGKASNKSEWKPSIGEVVKSKETGSIFLWAEYDGRYHRGIQIAYQRRAITEAVAWHVCAVEPTTREERTEFFSALTKAGWKWNSKKKELTKVQKEYKCGDFVTSMQGDVAIIEKRDNRERYGLIANLVRVGDLLILGGHGLFSNDFIRGLSTKKEKDALIAALKEKGKVWNAETKKVEALRWRAEKGQSYRYVLLTWDGAKVGDALESESGIDRCHYNSGNYFRTKEEAQKVADEINEIFKRNTK